MGTVDQFTALLLAHGSDVLYHRDDARTPCPCLTPEGFRDPEWHDANPTAPVCDENGMLPEPDDVNEIIVKAFVQPIQSTRATRLSAEYITTMFGEVQGDDHLGVFPCVWSGDILNFNDWAQNGSDYIEYAGKRFNIVNANLVPDPADGNPNHHWEVGLRLISTR